MHPLSAVAGRLPHKVTGLVRLTAIHTCFWTILLAACDVQSHGPPEQPRPVPELRLNRAATSLERGDTVRVAAVIMLGDAVLQPERVQWTSSNPSIADVSRSGLVTGRREGEATITAVAGELRAQAVARVHGRGSFLTLTPRIDTLHASGQMLQLSAMVLKDDGTERHRPIVVWRSLHPAVASISTAGIVTAHAAGTVGFVAEAHWHADTVWVVVQPPADSADTRLPVAALMEIAVDRGEVERGHALAVRLTMREAGGMALGGRAAMWSSSDPEVATVNNSGIVTGLTVGSVVIRATADGVTGATALFIIGPTFHVPADITAFCPDVR
jgi:hypothetical protein